MTPVTCDYTPAGAWHYQQGQTCPSGNLHWCVSGVPKWQKCDFGCTQGPINTNDLCNPPPDGGLADGG